MKSLVNCMMLLSSTLFVACNNLNDDNFLNEGDRQHVNFNMTIGGTESRTSTEGTGTDTSRKVTWRNGDEVGIFVDADTKAHRYLYDNSEGLWKEASTEDAITVIEGEKYSYMAYYPYNGEVVTTTPSNTTINATVKLNQNEKIGENSGFDLSDVLYANAKDVTTADVDLKYEHAFAMVEVLVTGDKVVSQPTTVLLKNIYPSAQITLNTGAVDINEEAGINDIEMYCVPGENTNENYLYRAVVPQQSVIGGDVLLEVRGVSGRNYQFKAPASGVQYNKGKYRRMVAKIGQASIGITFPSGSINEWTPDDELDPGEGEVIRGNLITVPISSLTGVLDNSSSTPWEENKFWNLGGNTNTNTETYSNTRWFSSNYNSDETTNVVLEQDNSENVLKVTMNASASYYKACLGYHNAKKFAPGRYKLSFMAKSSESININTLIRMSVDDPNAPEGKNKTNRGVFFYIDKTTNSSTSKNVGPLTAEWVEYTVDFDCTKGEFDSPYASSTDATAEYLNGLESAFQMFDLRLSVNTSKSTKEFYIKDVKLEEIYEDE